MRPYKTMLPATLQASQALPAPLPCSKRLQSQRGSPQVLSSTLLSAKRPPTSRGRLVQDSRRVM